MGEARKFFAVVESLLLFFAVVESLLLFFAVVESLLLFFAVVESLLLFFAVVESLLLFFAVNVVVSCYYFFKKLPSRKHSIYTCSTYASSRAES